MSGAAVRKEIFLYDCKRYVEESCYIAPYTSMLANLYDYVNVEHD